MEQITFKDGTVCNDSRAMESMYGLYLYFGNGMTINEVLAILMDSSKTEQISYTVNKATLTFEGYTRIQSVMDEGTAITAMMGRN